jgi:hypothetical protein
MFKKIAIQMSSVHLAFYIYIHIYIYIILLVQVGHHLPKLAMELHQKVIPNIIPAE